MLPSPEPRVTWIERPLYAFRVEYVVRPGLPATREDREEQAELELSVCELWLKASPERPLPFATDGKAFVVDLVSIDAVEDWDLWPKIHDELWQQYQAEEK